MIRILASMMLMAVMAACTSAPSSSSLNTRAKPGERTVSKQEIASYVPGWVGKMNVRPNQKPNLPTVDLLRGEDAAFVKQVFGNPLRQMNAGQHGLWVYRGDGCTMNLFVKDQKVNDVILRALDGTPVEDSALNGCFRSYLASKVDGESAAQ